MSDYDLFLRPLLAMIAGGLIGLERSYHGRAAGLRTYSLVALGSALLIVTSEHIQPAPDGAPGDPTRVIQGIVTGIGFLGAGVILKQGFVVRGLTTAASVWVASAVGVVIGAGFVLAGLLATAMTLVALSLLRHIEDRMRVQHFVHCHLAFSRTSIYDESQVTALVERFGFAITEMSYRLDAQTAILDYKFVMWSADALSAGRLQRALLAEPCVVQFHISPSRD